MRHTTGFGTCWILGFVVSAFSFSISYCYVREGTLTNRSYPVIRAESSWVPSVFGLIEPRGCTGLESYISPDLQ